MKISIRNATLQLLQENRIPDIETLSMEIKKTTKTKWKVSQISTKIRKNFKEDIDFFDYFINENGKIYYKEKIFSKTKFKIKLTPEEFSKKKLYIGHRFIPFITENFYPKNINLTDSNENSFNKNEEEMNLSDAIIYFSFLQMEHIAEIQKFENENLFVTYFDLKEWIKNNNFKKEDLLEIQVIDFKNNKYKLEKLSYKDFLSQKIINKIFDEKLEKAILKNIDRYKIMSISKMMFVSFGDISNEIEQTGFPLSTFVNENKNINLENSSGFPFLQKEGVSVFEQFSVDDMPEQGKSKSINGIFKELGYNYTATTVEALIVQQMITNNYKINIEKILSTVLKKDSFYNEKQAKNFQKAFIKLVNKTINKWENINLNKNTIELLNTAIEIEITINNLLRSIDSYLNRTDDENFDFSIIKHFQPIEIGAEQIIEYILKSKGELPNEDVNSVLEQFSAVLPNIKEDIEILIKQYH